MLRQSSPHDLFRFIQLRPPVPPDETAAVPLLGDTDLASALEAADLPAGRAALAHELLASDGAVRSPGDLASGDELTGALAAVADDPDATSDDLLDPLDVDRILGSAEFPVDRRRLCDTLLAAVFATQGIPEALEELQDLYRVVDLLVRHGAGDHEEVPVTELLARPIVLPFVARRPDATSPTSTSASSAAPGTLAPRAPGKAVPVPDRTRVLATALDELLRLDRPECLVLPESDAASGGATPFTLLPEARGRLSGATRDLLERLGVDLDRLPVHRIVRNLEREALGMARSAADLPTTVTTGGGEPVLTSPAPAVAPRVRPAGVADLLMVKQQINRYEAGEIAHVENVLAGEKKSRSHRQLDRTEETATFETERTREQKTELETTERFELNRETSRTLREDQQIGFGLELSGKYGPTIEFSSNFELERKRSEEEKSRNASTYAQSVVERSLERLVERVREERVRKVIRETEETNLHEIDNDTGGHVAGIYQFLEKVSEAQVFNYGVRQMFDFMVPEPASYLWRLEQTDEAGPSLPEPPPPLDRFAPSAVSITPTNYHYLAAVYGASGVEPPPPLYRMITGGVTNPGGEGGEKPDEEGHPRRSVRVELEVPEGYRPLRAWIQPTVLSDADPVLGFAIGPTRRIWSPSTRTNLGGDHTLSQDPTVVMSLDVDDLLTAGSKLALDVLVWESANYAVDIRVQCQVDGDLRHRWAIATYDKIRAAWQDRVREHEQRVAEIEAEARAAAERLEQERELGGPPSENRRTIRTELQKHCISILTRQWYDGFGAVYDEPPPGDEAAVFDFDRAAEEGAFIRFFEQAFEWDQLQWVLYPYFWARRDTWTERFLREDTDPLFREFLRAGSARVVVPVRPGFERAVTHYLETGKLWNGTGEPPAINSPLYVSIVDEIRSRTGAPQGELPEGEPWEVRVPTPLVYLRSATGLPRWERVEGQAWEWRPVHAPPGPRDGGPGPGGGA